MRTCARGLAASLLALCLLGCPGGPPPPVIPPCGPDTLATAPPLDMLDLAAVGPMGSMDPSRARVWPSQTLSFFVRSADPRLPEGEPARVPVVAPGRSWLQRARRSFFTGRPEEFSVTFRTCNEVTWTMEHMVFASPQVAALADDPGHNCNSAFGNGDETSFCEGTSEGIELAGGTELGLAGSSTNRSLDVSTRDTRALLVVFASGRQEKFTCPLDAFDPSVEDALRPLLGTPDGRRRTADPTCGEYMQDVRGTAAGNWSNNINGTRLALVHDHVDPGVAVISLNAPFVRSDLWRFQPTHSGQVNRDFREVTMDGQIYCYDAPGTGEPPSIVLIQLNGAEALRYELQPGASCGTGPWQLNDPFGGQFSR